MKRTRPKWRRIERAHNELAVAIERLILAHAELEGTRTPAVRHDVDVLRAEAEQVRFRLIRAARRARRRGW